MIPFSISFWQIANLFFVTLVASLLAIIVTVKAAFAVAFLLGFTS
ncbi:MAG: hypothetical protein V4550_18185 [Gemmatimonadota bacterium]